MKKYNNYFNNRFVKKFKLSKKLKRCITVEDYLARGRSAMSLQTSCGYSNAFISYEYAIRLDDQNFEAYLGLYKSWYLYSLSTNPTEWDLALDDHFRNLIAHTPKKYLEVVELMFEEDKVNYLEKVRENVGR